MSDENRKAVTLTWLAWAICMVACYALVWNLWIENTKVNRNLTEKVKVWLIGSAMIIVILRWAWHRWLEAGARAALGRYTRRALSLALATLCLASVLNYGRFGLKLIRDRIDVYDMIHYYLGSKYFDELGYFDLYPACILADLENDGPHFKNPPTYQAQDENGYEIRPFPKAIEHGRTVRKRFSEERWAAFSHDFVTLQRKYYGLTQKYWWQMVNDHGFNGSPSWAAYASPLANMVPVEHVKYLGYLDLGLLVVGLSITCWAFGPWAAGFLLIFLTTSYSTRWPTITWSFLRYDYVTGLIIATALIKKGRPLLSGAFAAHAAAMRLFPLTYLLGPGVRAAWTLVRRRRMDRLAFLFFTGFVIWLGLLHGNVLLRWGGDPILTHWEGMSEHMAPENLSSRREGLAIAIAYRGETDEGWSPKRIDRVQEQEPVRKILAWAMVLALAWGLRRAEPAEGFAAGFIAFFALATASYYYYVVRAPLVQVHSSQPGKTRHALALLWLLGIDLFCNYAQQYMGGNRIFVIGWMGWMLLAYSIGMIGVLWWESSRTGKQLQAVSESG